MLSVRPYGDLIVGDLRGNLYRFDLAQDRRRLNLPGKELADGVADNRLRGDLTESGPLLFGLRFWNGHGYQDGAGWESACGFAYPGQGL